jgi:hypothetical protein
MERYSEADRQDITFAVSGLQADELTKYLPAAE